MANSNRELSQNDQDQIQAVQEMVGYVIANSNDQQTTDTANDLGNQLIDSISQNGGNPPVNR